MRTTLDPKLDVVFKMLFGNEQRPEPLHGLLTAVLRPPAPIRSAKPKSPALPTGRLADKRAILDVLVELEDGSLVDVEMQAAQREGQRERAVYYTARLLAGQLDAGQPHARLRRCASIWIVNYRELAADRFHSVFRLQDADTRELLSPLLELHLLQLPCLGAPDAAGDPARPWGRFLAARTDEELEHIAMTHPETEDALGLLKLLSRTPDARQAAEDRFRAEFEWNHAHTAAREAGERAGREQGERAGREAGERAGRIAAVEALCGALGVELTDERREWLASATVGQLDERVATLAAERRWV